MKPENLKKAVQIDDTIEWVKKAVDEAIVSNLYGDDDVVPSSLESVNIKLKNGFLQLQKDVINELMTELEKL